MKEKEGVWEGEVTGGKKRESERERDGVTKQEGRAQIGLEAQTVAVALLEGLQGL